MPLFDEIGEQTAKRDLYLLAAGMTAEEIHPEVIEKLDRIDAALSRGADGQD